MELLMFIAMLILPLLAQLYVSSNYKKYLKIQNSTNLSGFDVARQILDANGLNDLYIVETKGTMSDHYDPIRKTIKLSKAVFDGESIASLAIAAHEVGHAIQDEENFSPMKMRSKIFPIVNFGTGIAPIVFAIGFALEAINLIWAAIFLVSLGLIFQLITLPVEFNASKRAKEQLANLKIVNQQDLEGVDTILKAAVYTYIAGVLASIINILRLIYSYTDRK